jgi:hypothetical protein
MGLRGPKPQPSILKFLKGNPGKRKIEKQPTMPPPGDGFPPKRMKGAALQEWDRLYQVAADRGIVHAGNVKIFERYCVVTGDLQKVENVSKRVGTETAISIGLFRAAASLTQQQRQLARDIGLTVLAGENLGDAQKPEGKLSKFIRPA